MSVEEDDASRVALKKVSWVGFPSTLRPSLWHHFCNTAELRESHQSTFSKILQEATCQVTSPVAQQIAAAVAAVPALERQQRPTSLKELEVASNATTVAPKASSHPKNQSSRILSWPSYFSQRSGESIEKNGENVSSLGSCDIATLEADTRRKIKNLLTALAAQRPERGYVQYSNGISAFLLSAFSGVEEDVFWILTSILDRKIGENIFVLMGHKKVMMILNELLLDSSGDGGLIVNSVLATWIQSFFIHSFPPQTTFRVQCDLCLCQ